MKFHNPFDVVNKSHANSVMLAISLAISLGAIAAAFLIAVDYFFGSLGMLLAILLFPSIRVIYAFFKGK